MAYIQANGINIAYETFGDNSKSPLFIIHGLTSNRLLMYDIAKALSSDRFAIVYDCRGHGQSDKPESYSLVDHGYDLIALIDKFGYDKADVYGISMGSYVACQAAILAPDRIDHLILGMTKTFDDKTGSSIARFLKQKGVELSEVNREEKMALLAEALWAPTTPEEKRKEILKKQALLKNHKDNTELSPKQIDAVNKALIGFDLRPNLNSITGKTLVLQGRYDGLNTLEDGKVIIDSVPNSKMVIMENSGHMSPAEEPEKTLREIKRFLTS
jgi:3-oxoadipate enol-lactonase